MITREDVNEFFDQMKKDLAEGRELEEADRALNEARIRFEKVWGVKVKITIE